MTSEDSAQEDDEILQNETFEKDLEAISEEDDSQSAPNLLLDPRTDVQPALSEQPRQSFTPGMIFKMLWTEPLDQETSAKEPYNTDGSSTSTNAEPSADLEGSNPEQREFWAGFLRFIVVSNDADSCTCVPISTYGGKACTPEEVRVQAGTHGIVYQNDSQPDLLPGEPKLGFPPVKVVLFGNEKETEKIAKESRVNYAKRILIKYGVKVLFLGELDIEGKKVMEDAVQKCM
ncbi:hypothetical protein NKR23_g12150 [Pleurostoma richardsiae]|uniref:DUF6590 domain-containing protein n=1 Tax=Pleurostoma richardsiae TaxID=41990 RepID=A0AA38R6G3_9PEZI|nr:hypothetical protein NKR23_g12150 [Pleurostoma richardsiae]